MAVTIKLKNASGSDPSASDLVVGEVAIRTDTGKLFTKKDDNSVAEISGGGIDDGDKGDITVSNSGATFTIDNGVIDNDNIASSAAIAVSKLTGVFPLSGGTITGDSTIASGITNKNIDIDINGSSTLIRFDDDLKATFGDSDDLQIFHDGSDSFIAVEGTGGLVLSSDALTIKNKARDENQAVFTGNGTVQLYNDNTIRLTTTSSGITVNGTATATAFSGPLTGNVTGNASGSSGSCTGNAATATALETARTIAGVSFDGSANISLNNNAITNGAGYITATLTNEEVQDIVGGMVTGNTETGITVTYQDGDGTLDFVVGTLNQDTTGTAAIATTVTVADESSDTTCFPLFATAATGNLAPKSGSNLAFNSSNGTLTATAFAGDGSALTGLPASGGPTGGGSDKVFTENAQTVTTNYTIGDTFGAACNAMAAGPLTINSGVTVTVNSGETLTIV